MNTCLLDPVGAFIKASTAFGGDDYPLYSEGFTEANNAAFERWLEGQVKVTGKTLYRGYCFEDRYWEDTMIEPGSVIGEDQMTQSVLLPGFTEGPLRASLYMNEFGEGVGWGGIKVLFQIHTKGRYFVDISYLSFYPSEDEYRCVRGTSLLVTQIKPHGGYTEVVCEEYEQ